MNELDLYLSPEAPATWGSVVSAHHRRALVADIVGAAESPADPGARRCGPMVSTAQRVGVPAAAGVSQSESHHVFCGEAPPGPTRVAPPAPGVMRHTASTTAQLQLDDALVVPAGALVRGYLRARALLLAGDIVGNVHCTGGPVVIRAGATLKGRLVAYGDVYVCGRVTDNGGGAVIATRGKLTLAPGARVEGDVRSGRLDLYDGAMLLGVARAYED